MSSLRTLLDEQGRAVCERCEVASRLPARAKGLLGRDGLEPGQGMLIAHTGSIHTFFMRFPIDVVFLDRRMRVRRIVHELPPNRLAASLRARSVLELPAGEAERAGIVVGSRLAWHDPVR